MTLSTNSSEFMKFDDEKIRLELIEPKFILGIGSILTLGAEKYGPHNWKQADREDIERIKGALLRHTFAYLDGEILDPESNQPHIYHIGCNLMFLNYFDHVEYKSVSQTMDSNPNSNYTT